MARTEISVEYGEKVPVGDRHIVFRPYSNRRIWMDEYAADGKLVQSRLVKIPVSNPRR